MKGVPSREKRACYQDRNVSADLTEGGEGVWVLRWLMVSSTAWQRTAQSSGVAGETESGGEDVDLGSVFENP